MGSFTPAPWFAVEQFSVPPRRSLGWIINHGNGRIGWSSYATAKPNEGEAEPFPIGKANAHLIAAAPELYAACQEALECINPELLPEVVARLTAAIAKAEGRHAE